MKHYIYSIKNTENNKMYIGMTNNPVRRKKRHFSDLRIGVHDNTKMQRAFNKYGEDKFEFEILLETDKDREEVFNIEIDYINKYNTFKDGYNLNEGGKENNGFYSRFSKEDVFQILSALEFSERVGGLLAEIFDTSKSTIRRMKSGESHLDFKNEYESMTRKERLSIYHKFSKEVNLDESLYKRKSKQHLKPLSEEECLFVLSMFEFNNRRTNEMCKKLNVSQTSLYNLKNRNKIYENEFDKYTSMSFNERFEIYKNAYIFFDIKCDFMQ